MKRSLAGVLVLVLSACGSSAQSGAATPTDAPASASPSPTAEPSPSPTAEPLAVLEPSVTFDLGQELGLVQEEDGVVYVQVDSGVIRLDPQTGDFEQVVDGLERPWGLNIGFGSAWVSSEQPGLDTVRRFDLETGEQLASITVGQLPVESLTAFGSIWVPNDHSGTVSRIDPETNEVVATIDIVETPSGGPVHVTAGAGRVWAASPKGNLVAGIDPDTNEVVAEITVPDITCGSTLSDQHLWIGKCIGSRLAWGFDPVTGEAIGELDAAIVTNGERTFAMTIEPATRNTLVQAVDPTDLSLSEPVAWPGIPGFVRFGADMLWTTSGTKLIGYAMDTLPAP